MHTCIHALNQIVISAVKYMLEKGRAPRSVILVWRIPWTEEPGGLQSTRSQRSQT